MKILFYFGHPAQYMFLRNAIGILKKEGRDCDIIIKSKDVLERLLIENKESYHNILPEGRNPGSLGTFIGLLKREIRIAKLVKNKHYDLFIGTDPSLAHIGYLKRIPVITVLEDDIDIVPKLAKTTFPFTSTILTPKGCKTGKYEFKTVHYLGYMKLAYLHPVRFEKAVPKIREPYILIRVSKLDAHHDKNISGINENILTMLVHALRGKGDVYISSEGELKDSFKNFVLKINPAEMLQVLAHSSMLISDSQSMTMEAAMLGIPSIRFSDFAGRISVLEELENTYDLTYGIKTEHTQELLKKINELFSLTDLLNEFQKRRQKMLKDKIDVTAFLVWFIQNYPESVRIMKEQPNYQYRFR